MFPTLRGGDVVGDLSKYSYTGADKEQDNGFASFDSSKMNLEGDDAADGSAENRQGRRSRPKGKTVKRVGEKVKPNAPCPCGSGKKYKKCCGANT